MTSAARNRFFAGGVIAGAGTMPFAVADRLAARGLAVVILALRAPAIRPPSPASAITGFRSASSARRQAIPQRRLPRPDLHRQPGAARRCPRSGSTGGPCARGRLFAAFRGGDDHLLSGIGRIFEQDGFRMIGVREAAPDLLMPKGCITRTDAGRGGDGRFRAGQDVLAALGPFDIGQAAVVIDGHVVAVEDIEGTDGLLARMASCATRDDSAPSRLWRAGEGAQERPGSALRPAAVGARTVEGAGLAGLPASRLPPERGGRRPASHDRGRRPGRPVRHGPVRVSPARTRRRRRAKDFPDRDGRIRRPARRQPDESAAPAARRRCAVRRHRRPRHDTRGPHLALSDRGIVDYRACRRGQAVAGDPAAHPRDRGRGSGGAPDILVIIDSPDFNHRVAKRVRGRSPRIPIVDYVSPTVWAWRPGRARAMRPYIDHVLALLPFEPDA